MKHHISFRKSITYSVLSILVSFILIFSLLPHDVLAKTYHVDLKIPERALTTPPEVGQSNNSLSPVKVTNTDEGEEEYSFVTPVNNPAPQPDQVISYLVPSDNDTEIKSPSGKIRMKMPKGAAPANLKVDFVERMPAFSTGLKMLKSFSFNARTLGTSSENVTRFNKDLEITIKHSREELYTINPDSLRLYYVDTKTNKWVPVATSKFDPKTQILTATLNHFTEFSEQADPLVLGPGRITSAQVNLNSGTATFSYPIELPPGPNKFAPKLELVYNSGVADGMKNKRAMGSWVGIGWTLHLGRITYSYDEHDYSLELNNASYKLLPLDAGETTFRTEIDDYFKITRSDNTWELWDREGVYYRFGTTSDSIQPMGPGSSRWHLSLMQDTNGNQATVSYIKNGNHSCYPEYLSYGNTQVHFVSSFDTTDPIDGSSMRRDTPKGYQNPVTLVVNYAPIVREDKKLDAIEIKTSGTLVRRYNFAYNTTDCVFSTDYNGIYYSGTHSLTSIAQVGADGASALPALTFNYQNLETYYYYRPNPRGIPPLDNPATFHWPHLTSINSGYGGIISFGYQPASMTAVEQWTKQLVVSKTVNGGIGATENATYSYAGGPRYDFGEYLGFDEVRVIDADGNYSKHYFFTNYAAVGRRGDAFSGREYRTRWYDAGNNLLREVNNDYYTGISGMQMAGAGIRTYDCWEIECPPGPPEPPPVCYQYMSSTTAVALLNNYVYITDAGNNTVLVFRKNLRLGVYGWVPETPYGFGQWVITPGENPVYDGISNPHGITISADGYVYVSDTGGKRIVVFDCYGTKVNAFTYYWQTGQYDEWGMPIYDAIDPYGISIAPDGRIYVADKSHNRVVIFSAGSYAGQLTSLSGPQGVAAAPDGYVYVADTGNNRIAVFDSAGNYVRQWGSLSGPQGVAIAPDGNVYVSDTGNNRIAIFDPQGNYIRQFYGSMSAPQGLLVTRDNYVYVADTGNAAVDVYEGLPRVVHLVKTEETMGAKMSRTRYLFDSYGNVQTEYHDGDISTGNDDSTIQRVFYPNTTTNILSKPGRERVYATITDDVGGSNLKKEACYYYDSSDNYTTPPSDGNLTRLQQKIDASTSVNTYYTYDIYGNRLTTQDPNGNITAMTYDNVDHIYPQGKNFPVSGMSENYTYEPGTYNLLTQTDVNGQVTTYQYDTFKRLVSVIKPGDSTYSSSIQYQYNDWGTLGQQNVKTLTKISSDNYTWQSKYFDGLGRVLQTQSRGETDRTIISGTTWYNDCGQVEKQYVSQDLVSSTVSGYKSPEATWRYSSSVYDAMGRVTTLSNADNTTVSHDYSVPWQEIVTNEKGIKKYYYYDAFKRLIEVKERDADDNPYASTGYSYDKLGNLVQVTDNLSNNTTMSYDWLSRKIAMTDPDMGSWSYNYDNNGNLVSQTDAKGQTVSMLYDAMNRITAKNYPAGSNTENVTYSYDSTDGFGPPFQWDHDINLGTMGPGSFYTDLANLTPDKTYYYRSSATNSAGTAWANSIASFSTGSGSNQPTVTNAQGASDLTNRSARLNGQVTAPGGEPAAIHIFWGATDGGTTPANWQHDEDLGNKMSCAFYRDISGLTDNTTYYYRCQATNSAGTSWAASSTAFTTNNWLTGWGYRKKLKVDGSQDGQQSDYQMKLVINYPTGNDNGINIYCNSHCKTDFSDLRFTKADGNSTLSYWIESKTNGSTATVWVKFDSIAAAPAISSFYLYYGNISATSLSNGINTFAFFDDASYSRVSSYTKRDIYASSSAYLEYVPGSGYKLWNSTNGVMFEFNGVSGSSYYFKGDFKNNTGPQFGFCARYSSSGLYWLRDKTTTGASNLGIYKEANPPNTSSTNLATTNHSESFADATWYTIEGSVTGSQLNCKSSLDGLTCSAADSSYSTGTWGIYANRSGYTLFKNIILRKYTTNEPSWGDNCDEEARTVSAPAVNNSTGASNIAATSARLNGQVSSTGGENPVVHIYWGDNDGGTNAVDWDHDAQFGCLGSGTFYRDVSGLNPNTIYYYRCYAANSAGGTWAASSSSFSNGWLNGWNNRKKLRVNGTSAGAQTDYQVKLNLNYGSGNDTGQCAQAIFSMTASADSYQYTQLTGILYYTITSTDYLEYDIYWTGPNSKIAFDYTLDSGAALRASSAVDQNGFSPNPATDISNYTENKWYSRKIKMPSSHTDRSINYYDIACENDQTGTQTGYIANVRITDGNGTVRKWILRGDTPPQFGSHLSNYGSLTSFTVQPAQINLNSRCKSNFDDIRFTQSDGASPLNYCLISKTDNVSAVVWVKLNSIPTAGADFYLYYGNSSAGTTSNGNNTFCLFDDFNDGTIDSSKWNVSNNVTEAGGYATITYSSAASYVSSNTTWSTPVKVIANAKIMGTGETYIQTHATGANDYYHYWKKISSGLYLCYSQYGAQASGSAGKSRDDNFHEFSINRNSSSLVRFSYDGSPVYSSTAANYNYPGAQYLGFIANTSPSTVTIDWALVAKSASEEPLIGIPSAEVSLTQGLSINNGFGATNITSTSARLNGELTQIVAENPTIHIFWGSSAGNQGKGRRTGMTDASGTSAYMYDTRGRLVAEKRTIDSIDYITRYSYDAADRLISVTYPTGENVTQAYNGRGLPYGLSGTDAGTLVGSTMYNQLGQVSEINLGNGLRTTFGYWGVGGTYDTSGGYYGKLWEIKTIKQPGGSPVLQDVQHTWDEGGNLSQRRDMLTSENETFAYDFLDRLTSASGPYTETFAYNQIGNIMTKNGASYTYGAKPHAVTAVGVTNYIYDANGNMTNRGGQVLTWDAENRPVSISENGTTSTFVYDGDGKRVKKTEGGQTIIYVNQYYEKNVATSNETSNYYLGSRIIAQKKGTILQYLHQDHLTGTSLSSDNSGNLVSTIKYFPFGECRNSPPYSTDILFTGQRLDSTGLYYYGARYYDPQIGRFISCDSVVQIDPRKPDRQWALSVSYSDINTLQKYNQLIRENKYLGESPHDPQALNRYSYVLNNPLKYVDPTGKFVQALAAIALDVVVVVVAVLVVYELCQMAANNTKSAHIDLLGLQINIYKLAIDANNSKNKEGDKTGQQGESKGSGRSTGDKIKDVQDNPDDWKQIGKSEEPATNKGIKGGKSERTLLENKKTGERLEQHKLYDKNGNEIKDKTHYAPEDHDIPLTSTPE